MITITGMDGWDAERAELLQALHHTLTFAEGLVEQVRRRRVLLERRAEVQRRGPHVSQERGGEVDSSH